jgi:RNA polymerase sigma-70 factor, ECF subfamily
MLSFRHARADLTLRRLDPESFVTHLPILYRTARAWTSSREDAEDLVQETIAQGLARPRLLRSEDDVGYLLRAMHNVLVSQYRAAGRRPVTAPLTEDLTPTDAAGIDPAGSDPERATELHEVFTAIAELPDEFRDAIVAVDVAGLSYTEAARVLNVPEGTVTSRLSRARDRLARRLEGQ